MLEQCGTERGAVARHFVALSTYLGHVDIRNTYWYLQATPEMMTDIAAAAETLVWRERRMTKLAPLITGFLRDYMPRQRGYSPHSCETYAFSFKLLFDFAAKRLGTRPSLLIIEELDAPLILAFLVTSNSERGNGVATRNLRLAAIKTFMRYVEYQVPSALEQIGQIHAIPVKRHDQKLIRHLTMEEVRAILNAPDLTTRLGVRDRAMMHLCFAGGLAGLGTGRVHDGKSIPPAWPPSVLVLGKGRKERCLPLWKETAADLRALAERAGLSSCARALRQCRRGADDAGRLRVCAGQARSGGGRDVPVLTRPFDLASSAAPQLRGDHVAGHPRHPKGRLVARSRRYPHHGGLPAHGSFRKAGGGRSGRSAGTAARTVQGTGRADRLLVDGRIRTAGVKSRARPSSRDPSRFFGAPPRSHELPQEQSEPSRSVVALGGAPCVARACVLVLYAGHHRRGGALEPMLSCQAAWAHVQRAFCWRITRHDTVAALPGLFPATARSRSSSPAASGGFLARQQDRFSPPSSAALRA